MLSAKYLIEGDKVSVSILADFNGLDVLKRDLQAIRLIINRPPELRDKIICCSPQSN